MDKVPLEVFLRIFSYLDKSDELNCLCVCKSWCRNIQTGTSLYHTAALRDEYQFKNFINFFKAHPDLRLQVKDLEIDDTEIKIKSFLKLPATFLNVKSFCHRETTSPFSDWPKQKVKTLFKSWSNSITKILEFGSPIAGPAVLATGLCPNLVSLEMAFLGYEREDEKLEFIRDLTNAPNLKYLKLQWMNLSLKDAEALFKNTPNLKALGLSQIGFPPGKIGRAITPAPQVETICIYQGYFAERNNNWMSYFSKKCVNMKNFILTHNDEDAYFEATAAEKKQFKELVTDCTNLEFLHVDCIPIPDALFSAKSHGKSPLKTIYLSGYEASAQLKKLCKSVRKDDVVSLTIEGVSYSSLECDFKSEKNLLTALSKFPKLKHFRVFESKIEVEGQESNIVPLAQLLEYLPNLETIHMDFATFELKNTDDKPFKTSLKTLILEESYVRAPHFDMDSMEFLEQKLPNTDIIERSMDDKDFDEDHAHFFRD